MSKLKKMNLNNLKSQTNKEFTQRSVIIDQYEFLIDDKFKPSKIQLLIAEFQDKFNYAEENQLLFNPILMQYLLLIKHFTNINVPNEYEKQIDMLNTLIDLEYLETILNEFNEEEVNKISNMIKRGINNTTAMLGELNNQVSELNKNADI